MPDYRNVPSIEQLRQRPAVRVLEAQFGADATLDALRAGAAAARVAIAAGDTPPGGADSIADQIEALAALNLGEVFRPSLQPVINATGVLIHTNLGRAPLAPVAIDRMAAIARGYATLEYDVARGERGRRDVHAESLLCRLTGAEAALVVNNNAAAVMLVLAALGAGREVVVSRGELVEIGGGFRVPDVMAQSGAVLREVGTTNKTRVADYAAAINDRTALILRVHPSNFRIEGFTERPGLEELIALGRQLGVPVVEDLGSGHLAGSDRGRAAPHPLDRLEPAVEASVGAGVDLCCFSGDKLLGGPQSGIVVGRAALLDRVRRHPLMRALRVDKLTYGALEATLAEYAAGRAATTIPVQRMLTMRPEQIRPRAEALAAQLNLVAGWQADLLENVSTIGGGSAPGIDLPTWVVAVRKQDLPPANLEERLRRLTPPVIARIEKDRLLLDLRTVLPDQDAELARLMAAV